MKPLLLYHADCWDGLVAAWCARCVHKDAWEYRPIRYSDPVPDDAKGREVTLVDFCFDNLEDLLHLCRKAPKVRVIDHHASVGKNLAELPRVADSLGMKALEIVFDTTKSGARLAWEFFHPGRAAPGLVLYAEDRDLWKFQLPGSREAYAFVSSFPKTFESCDELDRRFILSSLLNGHLSGDSRIVEAGSRILAFQDELVREMVSRAELVQFSGYTVYCAPAPVLRSEVCGELARGMPFGLTYRTQPDGVRVYDLRFRDFRRPIDVGQLAASVGGGGHKNAAGFQVVPGKLDPVRFVAVTPGNPAYPGTLPWLSYSEAVPKVRTLADAFRSSEDPLSRAHAVDHPTLAALVVQDLIQGAVS